MNDFYAFVSNVFNKWFYAPDGLNNHSKWASNFLSVYAYYVGSKTGIEDLSNHLRYQVTEANRFIIETMNQLSSLFASSNYRLENDSTLDDFRRSIEEKHTTTLGIVKQIITKIELNHLTKDLFLW